MELKILGASIIVITFALVGFYFSYKPIYRQNDLLEIKRAILILMSEIKFLSTSIEEALKPIENTLKSPIKDIFSYFRILIQKNEGESIEELWTKALYEKTKNTYLTKNDLDKLKILGSSICNYDKELNLNSFNLILDYIENISFEINREKPKTLRMYQSLSILMGLMVVILLI